MKVLASMNRKTKNWLRVVAVLSALLLFYVMHRELAALYRTGENPSIVGDQVTILTLGKADQRLDEYAWSYGDATITGRYVLTPEQVTKLKSEFEKLSWNFHGGSVCHDPGFVIQGSRFLLPTDDISVCFQCNNIEIGGFFMRHTKDFVTSSSPGLRDFLMSLPKP